MRRLLLFAVTTLIAIKSLWADVASIVDIVISRGEWTEMHYPTEPQNTEAALDTRAALSGDGKTLVELFPSANGGFGRLRVQRREGSSWVQLGQDIDGGEGAASLDWIIDTSRTGDRIAVRTQQYLDHDTGVQTQSLLLLEYQGGTWSQVLSYQAPPGHQGIATGDLTPDADVIAIGTYGNGTLNGEVRVFDIVNSQPQSTGGPQLVAKGDAIVGGTMLEYAAVPSLDAAGDTLAVSAGNLGVLLGIPIPPAHTFKIFEFDGGETAGWRQVFAESDYWQWSGQGSFPFPLTDLSDNGTVLIFSNRGYSYPGSPEGYNSYNIYDSVSASGIIQRYEWDQLAGGWGRVGEPIIGDQGDQLGTGLRGVSPGGNFLLVDTQRFPAQAAVERRRASVESVQLFGLTVPLPEGAVLNIPDHSKSAITETQAAIENTFQVVEWVGDGWAQKGESSSYAVVYQTPPENTHTCGYVAPDSHLTDSADLVLVDVSCASAGLFHTPELYSFTTLTDKIALTDLYAALGGPNWTEHTGWLRDEFHCAWQGVLCDSDGFVSALWLDENNLLGTVPDAVGRLRHLRSLDLSGNALSGGLPANLSQLVNLSQLFLGNAGLSGTLESSFGDMRQLTYLDMSGNQISGNLATFSGLENLRFMSLADNTFTGNFPSNGAWPLLEHLNLSGNAVSGALPSDVNSLAKLRYLDLSENAFSGNLPISLEYLTSLETIDLSENALDGPIGESLGAFLAARDPVLVGNDFNCPYPSALVDYFTAEEEQCVPPDPPAKPIILKTDYGDGEVLLLVAVAADGGAAIATYDAFCSNGEQVFTGSSTTTRILVSGLTNGVTYTCMVTATNSVGTSSASAATDSLTPEETSTGLPFWLLYQATQ